MHRGTKWKVLVTLTSSVLSSFAVAALVPQRQTVRAGTSTVTATVVRVPLSQYEVRVATAGPRVGSNAPLLRIAQAAGATCAINGTFLDVHEGGTGEPYGTVVVDGRALHLGSSGVRLDVSPDGTLRFVPEDLRVRGSVGSSSWYAYNLNVTPRSTNYSYVFTPEFGPRLTFAPEVGVVVRGGVVVRTAFREAVAIPGDGFVVAFNGAEVRQLSGRFTVGLPVTYRVVDASNVELGARFSVGAGPMLVRNGTITADAFTRNARGSLAPTVRSARSAVGVTARGEVLLVTFSGASIPEVAGAMRALGATDAMNLDGGASSSLVCDGQVVTAGGRAVANALVVRPKR